MKDFEEKAVNYLIEQQQDSQLVEDYNPYTSNVAKLRCEYNSEIQFIRKENKYKLLRGTGDIAAAKSIFTYIQTETEKALKTLQDLLTKLHVEDRREWFACLPSYRGATPLVVTKGQRRKGALAMVK